LIPVTRAAESNQRGSVGVPQRRHALEQPRRQAAHPGVHRVISFSSVQGQGHHLTPGAAGFEDGTVSYLSTPRSGLAWPTSRGSASNQARTCARVRSAPVSLAIDRSLRNI
jgi:hypothetical protein